MSTAGPLQEQYQATLKELARFLDSCLNGDAKGDERKLGFALLMFEFGEAPTSDRINYISNSRRDDMVCALKELVARFEGRHIEETQTAVPTEKQ